ncbi:MAG: hypothetical protein ACXWA3_08750 [Acidimicrobiales bacterium]
MKNALALKVAVPVAVVALGLLGAAPISAQTTVPPSEEAVLTVTKSVVGTAPTDAQFTLHITCNSNSNTDSEPETQAVDYDEDMTFGSTGGSKDFVFFGPSQCEVTETDSGGADSSTGPVQVAVESPIAYSAEIVNTFDPAVTTTTAPAAPAPAVEATAAFTG